MPVIFFRGILPIAVCLLAGCPAPGVTSSRLEPPVTTSEFSQPGALANVSAIAHRVEVSLTAAPQQVKLVGDQPSDAYVYNGSYPGPTLDLAEGDHVLIHFKNNLQEATNMHWHGLHVPSSQDGLPMDLVAPGASRDYEFDIPAGSAGTYWYHPHPHGATAMQVAKGLFGAIRVRAAVDPVPSSMADTLLVLSDNRFGSDGSISADNNMDRMMGRQGDRFFVNGKIAPVMNVRAGEIRRLRIINASAGHFYHLVIPGHQLLQIGTDGGLIPLPVLQDTIALAPAERVEVLVTASGKPGDIATLEDMSDVSHSGTASPTPMNHGGMLGPMFRVADLMGAGNPLMALRYSNEAAIVSPTIPTTLREISAPDTSAATTHTITFTDIHTNLDFRINDQKFDPARVDIRAKLGSTEVWSIVNKGDMDHPFHLPGFQFQVLDRAGVPAPFRAWKDTVNVRQGETVRIAVKFADFAGPRVFHCHVLEHEDLGMMGLLQVD